MKTHLKNDISEHWPWLGKILLQHMIENVVQDHAHPEQQKCSVTETHDLDGKNKYILDLILSEIIIYKLLFSLRYLIASNTICCILKISHKQFSDPELNSDP
jgi:hypothetical protein